MVRFTAIVVARTLTQLAAGGIVALAVIPWVPVRPHLIGLLAGFGLGAIFAVWDWLDYRREPRIPLTSASGAVRQEHVLRALGRELLPVAIAIAGGVALSISQHSWGWAAFFLGFVTGQGVRAVVLVVAVRRYEQSNAVEVLY